MSKPDLASPQSGRLLDVGYEGQIVDMQFTEIDSRTNEAATVIPFGVAVARGTTADFQCKAQAADGDAIIGISVRHPIKPADSSGNNTYARYDSVPVLRKGNIYVTALENAVRGDGAIAVTAQSGKIGSTTGGAAGTGRIAIPGAKWETTTAAGAVGIVRIAS